MGMGNRFLKKIKQCILENLKMVKNKVKVNSYGKLKMKTINKKHWMVHSKTEISKDMQI